MLNEKLMSFIRRIPLSRLPQKGFSSSRDLLHRVLLARTVFIVQDFFFDFLRGMIGSLSPLVTKMFDCSQETFAGSRNLLHRILLARTVFIVQDLFFDFLRGMIG